MNIYDRFLVLLFKGFFSLINKLFPPRVRAIKRLVKIENHPEEALKGLEEETFIEMRPSTLAGTEGLTSLAKTVEIELGINRDQEREEMKNILKEQFISIGNTTAIDTHKYLDIKKENDRIIIEKISVPFYDPAKELLIRALYFDKELLKDLLREVIRKNGLLNNVPVQPSSVCPSDSAPNP